MKTIASYELPNLRPEGPASHWEIDPVGVALLVHDMQEYFVSTFDPSLQSELVNSVTNAVSWARCLNMPVLYTAQPGGMSPDARGILTDFWGSGMTGSATDVDIVCGLQPAETEPIFTKWRYSAFVGNGLAWHLQRLGIRQLLIVGVYASVGILATALDAFNRDLQPFVISDCVADFDAESHTSTLAYIARYCGKVTNLNALTSRAE